jgi:hypothetical protein
MSMSQLVPNSPSSKVCDTLSTQQSHRPRPGIIKSHTEYSLCIYLDVMREYRRLDDTIVMRLNRSDALFKDSARLGRSQRFNDPDMNAKFDASDDSEACLHIWRQLIGT